MEAGIDDAENNRHNKPWFATALAKYQLANAVEEKESGDDDNDHDDNDHDEDHGDEDYRPPLFQPWNHNRNINEPAPPSDDNGDDVKMEIRATTNPNESDIDNDSAVNDQDDGGDDNANDGDDDDAHMADASAVNNQDEDNIQRNDNQVEGQGQGQEIKDTMDKPQTTNPAAAVRDYNASIHLDASISGIQALIPLWKWRKIMKKEQVMNTIDTKCTPIFIEIIENHKFPLTEKTKEYAYYDQRNSSTIKRNQIG